jgi:ATP/maltotriose-dependent transcriptional regulator MalT
MSAGFKQNDLYFTRKRNVSRFDQLTFFLKLTIVFWEQTEVLLPIYRLAASGISDAEIAEKLNITEASVQSCMAWLLHFLKLPTRNQLIQHAAGSPMSL